MEIVDNKKTAIGIALLEEKEIKKLIEYLKFEEDYEIRLKKEILWEYPILTGTIYVNEKRKQEVIKNIRKMIK